MKEKKSFRFIYFVVKRERGKKTNCDLMTIIKAKLNSQRCGVKCSPFGISRVLLLSTMPNSHWTGYCTTICIQSLISVASSVIWCFLCYLIHSVIYCFLCYLLLSLLSVAFSVINCIRCYPLHSLSSVAFPVTCRILILLPPPNLFPSEANSLPQLPEPGILAEFPSFLDILSCGFLCYDSLPKIR